MQVTKNTMTHSLKVLEDLGAIVAERRESLNNQQAEFDQLQTEMASSNARLESFS